MRVLCAVITLGALAYSTPAEARVIRFLGPHPVAPNLLHGMCFIEGPHVHSYVPHKRILYVKAGKHWTFVGDPVEFEKEPPKHSYYGHHPVFWAKAPGAKVEVEAYCYIRGPHHHWYAPPAHLKVKFKRKGGVYWYVGGHPRYYKPKHWKHRAIGRHYVKVRYPRPVVVVEPPSGFIGVIVGPHGVHGGVKITGPGVKVHLPWGVKIKGGMHHGMWHGMWHGKGHYKYKGMGHYKVKGMGHYKYKGRGMHGRYKRKGMGRW